MRGALLLVALALAGCGKREEEERAAATAAAVTVPSVKPKPTTTDAGGPLAFDGQAGKLVDEYKENVVASDKAYKDKRVRVKLSVKEVGRTKDGMAFIATTHIDGARETEPNFVAYFLAANEGETLTVKRGDAVTIEGVCRGRIDDGIFRQLKGYEFFVALARCRIIAN